MIHIFTSKKHTQVGGIRRDIIDVHAHILPGVDDGARDLQESCELACQAISGGILTVIATPHTYRSSETDRYRSLIEEIQQEIRKEHPDFTVCQGQELYYHEDLVERLGTGEALSMAGSRYVLVEFDPSAAYGYLYRGIRALCTAGYRPVLAHMERYACLRKEENLEDLMRSGCLLQMNYQSLQGSRFHPEVRWCREQVLEGRIHMLGTDMHRRDFRPPDIAGALEWLTDHVEEELIDAMTRENPMLMIKNKNI